MTAAVAAHRAAPAAGGGPLTGTGAMLRLALRRDRVKLPAWTLGIALLLPYFAAVAGRTTSTREDLEAAAQLVSVPMLRLFTGPAFGMEAATLPRYVIAVYFVEFLLGAALMNILLIARHTRAEEQSGRAELIRAAVVGRHAPLTAALLLAAITNAVLTLLLAIAAVGVGLPPGSALLFAAGTAATGLVFAGVTAVTAQLTEHSRGAAGLAGAVLGAVWVIRGVGAAQEVHGGPLTWWSPMGWAQFTRVLADERWWPLLLSAVSTAALVATAYALSARRDLGAGLLPARRGRESAGRWLRSPFTLALRLQRASLLWWGASLAVAGLVFGALAGSMRAGVAEEFIGAGPDVLGGYLSLMAVGMVFLVGVFTILSATRLRAEETRGRVAPLLAAPTGRWAWLGASLLATAVGAVALLALAGVGLGVGAALSVGESGLVGELTAAVLVRTPEVLFLLALTAALFGLAPRAVALSWAVLAYGGFVRFWAGDLPDGFRSLSPFDHIPRMPLEDFRLAPLVALTALAAALALTGVYGFRRRDLDGG
ncbi:ABC transporter permease [Allonocardiopsis opalescens]|uniref:ABC-2 type transport system permease protein n=1 Tax=Allonocardiopsis opalescens TaxID=1144618 RepID=A0A2T0PYX1_9ACTN|nr:ABC transporter permease [Allonocardiopsis opalescens]PRX96712.1 ABC-2 type transport system permease protein [Allonocardiopsis opalescens]